MKQSSPALGLRVLQAWLRSGSPLSPLQVMAEEVGYFFQIPLPAFHPYVVFGPQANRAVLVTQRDKLLWRNTDPVTDLLRRGVLVVDGRDALFESNAIVEYLDEVLPPRSGEYRHPSPQAFDHLKLNLIGCVQRQPRWVGDPLAPASGGQVRGALADPNRCAPAADPNAPCARWWSTLSAR